VLSNAACHAKEIATTLGNPYKKVDTTIRRSPLRVNHTSRRRLGAPKTYNLPDERHILRIAHRNPRITYTELINQTGIPCSRPTLYRIFKKHGTTKWLAQKRPGLTEEHARLRLAFAQRYVSLSAQDWLKYIFSYECSVEHGKGKQREWIF